MTACTQNTRTEVTLSYPVSPGNTATAGRTVVWDDSVYAEDGAGFDPETARTCAVLCACAGSSDLAQDNLSSLGFEKTAKFSYEKSYSGDRVGVLFSKKRIGDATLIAIVIRGTQGREWYSNFDIGTGVEHAGFAACADFVLDKLDMYTVDYGLQDADRRYLVTGYSRGGAVANIVAKRLVDSAPGAVTAYTFATPNTTTLESTADYSGIYNIVREEDFFTYVPLSAWGYRRYGTDIRLSTASAATPDNVQTVFHDITGDDYVGFDTAAPIEGFLSAAAQLAPSVDAYYDRAYPVGDRELTMYDYMMIAARFLCEEEREDDTDLLIETLASDYAQLTGFFMTGVDIEELMFTGDFTRSSVADSHAYVSYMAALDEYIDSAG